MPLPGLTDEPVLLRSAGEALTSLVLVVSNWGNRSFGSGQTNFPAAVGTDRRHQCRKPLSDRICLVRRFTSCFHCSPKCFASV